MSRVEKTYAWKGLEMKREREKMKEEKMNEKIELIVFGYETRSVKKYGKEEIEDEHGRDNKSSKNTFYPFLLLFLLEFLLFQGR